MATSLASRRTGSLASRRTGSLANSRADAPRKTGIRWTGLALLLAFGSAACSSNGVQGAVYYADANDSSNSWQFGDGQGTDGKTTSDAAKTDLVDGATAPGEDGGPALHQLVFVQKNDDFGGACESICALQVNQNGLRQMQVQYLVAGQPVPDALLEFSIDQATPALGSLSATNVPTDENGKGQADLKAGQDVGLFAVNVRVPSDPDAGTLRFEIHVISKAKGPLEIRLHYVGSKSLSVFGMVKARLTLQQAPGDLACKDIDLGDTLPPATWESPPNLQWDKPWTITWPQFAASLPQNGDPVTFTIIGVAATSNGAPLTAAGCIDTATVKLDLQTKTVEGDSVVINVMDIPPRLKGVYDLTTHLDLLSVLPPTVEMVLKTIIDVVTDPVAGVLSLVCKLGNGSFDSFCGAIFKDPKKPDIKQLAQPFGGIIVKLLDAILLSLLPENVKTGLAAGADLGEILTNLEIGGTIELMAEPDNTGFLDKKLTKDNWSSITYKWSLGQTCNKYDPMCGKKTFNIEAFQPDAITGQFDLWRDVLKSEIKIAEHALAVKWGALINFIVEKQLLPLLFADPLVDSYGAMLKVLIGGKGCMAKDACCDNFASKLAGSNGPFSITTLSGICEGVATFGSAFLESQLTQLDGASGDPASGKGLLLGTEHCAIFDMNQDNIIEHIGAKTSPCTWNMTLGLLGSKKALKSTFYAVRQN